MFKSHSHSKNKPGSLWGVTASMNCSIRQTHCVKVKTDYFIKLNFFLGFEFDSAPRIFARLLHVHLLRAAERDHLGDEAFERALETGPQTEDQFENLFRGRKTTSRRPQARDGSRAQIDLRPLRLRHRRHFHVDKA